uniref:Uncharacterized protein n=1 Tax=viral metagenome TaxID=1070528 RepID=A0A6C0IYF8_9ZZZZ
MWRLLSGQVNRNCKVDRRKKCDSSGNSLITSIVVPGTNITSSETAFYRSESFPVTVLNEGPHCGSGRINWNFTSQLLRRSNNFLAFHPIG